MTYSMKKVIVGAMSLSGMALVIISFQNCAAPLSAFQENLEALVVPADYTGDHTVSGGVLSGGASYSDFQSGITIKNTSYKADNCAASEAVLSLQVHGAGSNPFSCMESFVAGRETSFRCTSEQFVSLASLNEWNYTSSTDTWTYSSKLANHDIYAPGTYRFYVQGRGTTVAVSFQIKSSISANSCQTVAVSPEPPVPTPSSSGNGEANCPSVPGVTIQDIPMSLASQMFNIKGTNSLILRFKAAGNEYLFGTVAAVPGPGGLNGSPRISISRCPGEAPATNCDANPALENSLGWTFETNPSFTSGRKSSCRLERGGVYYLHLRYVAKDGSQHCHQGSKGCSFFISMSGGK